MRDATRIANTLALFLDIWHTVCNTVDRSNDTTTRLVSMERADQWKSSSPPWVVFLVAGTDRPVVLLQNGIM